jgi:PhnB protein
MKKKAAKKAKAATKTAARKVLPVPAGFHTVTPYLVCRDAGKAIDFYAKAFGAKEKVRMPGPDGKVMHGEFCLGDSVVMIGEEMPAFGAKSPASLGGSPVSIFLYVKDVDKTFAQAVAAGCTVTMPLADQFWGDRYGKLSDPYGHQWGLATHKENVTPKEMAKRQEEFFAQQAKAAGAN